MRQDSLTVKITLKERAKNARLYYLTTGHGGWGGGDEFNQKPNTLYLDGEKVISFEMCIRDSFHFGRHQIVPACILDHIKFEYPES